MKMKEIPIGSPPSYEYESTGPWFVSHVTNRRTRAWIMNTFESAVMRFWFVGDAKMPKRRVMVDAMGVTVIATDSMSEDYATMSGTRQVMDVSLAIVTKSADMVGQTEMLTMIEVVRSRDGQAI